MSSEQLIRVEWLDAHGAPAGWEFEDEYTPAASRVVSVGHCLAQDSEFLVLVPHLAQQVNGAGRRQFAGHIAIPAAQVISVCALAACPTSPADPRPASEPTPPVSSPPECCSSVAAPCRPVMPASAMTSRCAPLASPLLVSTQA